MEVLPEVLKRLDVLADKVGETGERLWYVLVEGHRAHGIVSSVTDALLAVVGIVMVSMLTKKPYFDDDGNPTLRCLTTLFGLIAVAIVFATAPQAVHEWIASEYFALREILGK